MTSELILLAGTAGFIGIVHTLLGPDHYIPFVMMSRAQRWSPTKTAVITLLCGVGHVLGSIALGLAGIGLGLAISNIEAVEAARGSIAAWLLLTFGLVYCAWGLRQAARNHTHEHWHAHGDGTVHTHQHQHKSEHLHVHEDPAKPSITPWVLFTIFAFGPCEALIPTLMYPAFEQSLMGVLLVTGVFAVATISTMLVVVGFLCWGTTKFATHKFERYSHAIAGATLSACALMILTLPI